MKVINKKIIDFLKPQIIYVPLEDDNERELELLVKIGSYVFKNQKVIYNKYEDIYSYSSVSGYVVNIVNKFKKNGKSYKCLLIENDFKEKSNSKTGKKNLINTFSKEEFISMLKRNAIRGCKSNSLTYKKYDKSNLEYLLVNGVECETNLISDKVLMYNYPEEILEAIDAIIDIMNLKMAVIVLKMEDTNLANLFNKYLGTYPRIKVYGVVDKYPSGYEDYIVRYLLDKKDRKKYVMNNVSTIYSIYEMLKLDKPQTEKLITVCGNGLKKNNTVKVKMYSSFEEILYHTNAFKTDDLLDYYLVAGSLERGRSIPTDELIVTHDLEGITILKKEICKRHRCISCGKCNSVCPVGIYPNVIVENKDNKNNLKKLKYSKCIECGLCSKVCPSKINLLEIIRSIKEDK